MQTGMGSWVTFAIFVTYEVDFLQNVYRKFSVTISIDLFTPDASRKYFPK